MFANFDNKILPVNSLAVKLMYANTKSFIQPYKSWQIFSRKWFKIASVHDVIFTESWKESDIF